MIKAVRTILFDVEYELGLWAVGKQSMPDAIIAQIRLLRSALLPLISIEGALASEISGGASIAKARGGDAYVRSGWQNPPSRKPREKADLTERIEMYGSLNESPTQLRSAASLAARAISASVSDIKALWFHPTVQRMIKNKGIRLDEAGL